MKDRHGLRKCGYWDLQAIEIPKQGENLLLLRLCSKTNLKYRI